MGRDWGWGLGLGWELGLALLGFLLETILKPSSSARRMAASSSSIATRSWSTGPNSSMVVDSSSRFATIREPLNVSFNTGEIDFYGESQSKRRYSNDGIDGRRFEKCTEEKRRWDTIVDTRGRESVDIEIFTSINC
jgi:hypothetical protein